jgi:ubiquinone/menaquinone biosynthesis C-methylase UbiE
VITKTSIICPNDHTLLEEKSAELVCSLCNRTYPILDAVICTIEKSDTFYEGAYENQVRFLPRSERWWHTWPLWLINGGFLWTVRRHVPPGKRVVELGCAGGVSYFGQRYRMIGCDLSLSSLKRVEGYERKLQSDASRCIPVPDECVDAIVSSYFWEHIPPIAKEEILRECMRVLRPGGKLIFLYDVETSNPLIKKFRRLNEALYARLFISDDGHFGYEKPSENLRHFKQAGFSVIEHRGLEKTPLQSPSAYSKLAKFNTAADVLFGNLSRLGGQPYFYFYTFLTRFFDAFVCPLLPAKWSRMDMVVCEKTV